MKDKLINSQQNNQHKYLFGSNKFSPSSGFWILFVLGIFPCIGLLSTAPSWASLGNIWIDFQAYSNDFRNYLSNQTANSFNPLQSTVNSSINNATGDLRIPNPNTTNQDINSQVSQYPIPDKYENNPVVRANQISQKLDREITRGAIAGSLGSGGQARIKNTLESAQNSVQKVNVLAETANTNKQKKQIEIQAAANSLTGLSLDNLNPVSSAFSALINNQAKLTQLAWEGLADLELDQITIQQEQTKILAANLGVNLQMQQDLQYNNLNLINISSELEDMNRDRRIENATAAARLLRVTSQSGLISREVE